MIAEGSGANTKYYIQKGADSVTKKLLGSDDRKFIMKDGVFTDGFTPLSRWDTYYGYNSTLKCFTIKKAIPSAESGILYIDLTNMQYFGVDYTSGAYGRIIINTKDASGEVECSCSGMLYVGHLSGYYYIQLRINTDNTWSITHYPGRLFSIWYQ